MISSLDMILNQSDHADPCHHLLDEVLLYILDEVLLYLLDEVPLYLLDEVLLADVSADVAHRIGGRLQHVIPGPLPLRRAPRVPPPSRTPPPPRHSR